MQAHRHTVVAFNRQFALPRQQWLRERASLLRCSTFPVLFEAKFMITHVVPTHINTAFEQPVTATGDSNPLLSTTKGSALNDMF